LINKPFATFFDATNISVDPCTRSSVPTEESLKGLIQHNLITASGIQFVAEQNGNLLGFATLYFSFSILQVKKMAILNDLFVIPEARGQKLGEKLFQTCLSNIRK